MPRSAFLLAKYATLVAAALLFVLLAVAVAAPLTGWFTHQITGALSWADLNLAELGLSILRTTYTTLPYLSLAFLVAILTRSTAAAIGLGLGFAFLEEVAVQLLGLAGGIWAEAARYAPANLAAVVMQTNLRLVEVDLGTRVDAGLPGPWAAAGGIVLYALACLGLSLWAFRRQNLTG